MLSFTRHLAALKRGDYVRTACGFVSEAVRNRGKATLVDTFPDLHAVRLALRSDVLSALATFEPIVLAGHARRQWRVMLRREHAAAAREALSSLEATGNYEVCAGPESSLIVRAVVRVNHRDLTVADDFRLRIDLMTCSDGMYTSTAMAGLGAVEAARWGEIAADSLRGPLYVSTEPAMPIDVVYTWVDGSDPEWRQRKAAALADDFEDSIEEIGPKTEGDEAGSAIVSRHASADDASRFESHDELRYSMRSVEMFASWVRHIFVVTDNQTPEWLAEHPKVTVVSHRDIIGHSVFNSHAIEASLHRIPGLSEHYLYLNDDMFFGQIVYPSDFYASEGLELFFPSDLPIDPGAANLADLPIMTAAKNGRDLIAKHFGIRVDSKVRHTVYPQLKRVARDLEEAFPGEVERTRRSLLRSPSDISVAASLQHWFAFATGRGVPAETSYLYVNLQKAQAPRQLDALESLRRYQTFCLNLEDSLAHSPETESALTRMLTRYFPLPAPWEKTEGSLG